jgi:FkbM family methyltransferase
MLRTCNLDAMDGSMDYLTFDQFDENLVSANDRFKQRLPNLMAVLNSPRVYLFGYGGKGRTLAGQIAKASAIKVVVYDSSAKGRAAAANDGFATVDNLDDISRGEDGIVLGACQAQLEQAALVNGNRIYYQEAAYLFDAPHLAHKAREFSSWILANKQALYQIYQRIHSASRQTFINILRFRLSLDPQDLAPSRKPNSDMWFDIPEKHSQRDYATFLDVGAYDGDTLRQAQDRLGVTRGIAVEANSSLFSSINKVAASYKRGILILPHAAWSHRCQLQFSEVRGGMISVSETSNGELQAAPIDENVKEGVDLMKMDIEGAELPALEGCKQTLRTAPDLALAAYHRPDDLVTLPAFLATVGYVDPKFSLHVGHYSDSFDDTILYYVRNH